MAVNLSPVGGVAGQFFDNNGDPLVGGKLYTYAAGTTTPQTTYTSSLGTTPNSNPIILNAGGRVPSEIWLTDGLSYKFVLYTSTDQLVGSWDDISGINSNFVNFTSSQEIQTATSGQTVFTLTTMQYQPGTNSLTVYVDGVNQYGPGAMYAYVETNSTTVTFNAGLHVGAEVKFTTVEQATSSATDAASVAYTPAGTGAVTTNVQAKLRETVSVKDFGAVGDGVTDDTAAVHAAIDFAKTRRGAVFFPVGTYRVTSGYTDVGDYQDVRLYGEGSTREFVSGVAGSHIRLDSTSPSSFFYRVNSRSHLQLENLTFSCAQYVLDRKFIAFNAISNSFSFDNLNFESVEKPICFELDCYFQSSTITNVQFRNSGSIHSEVGNSSYGQNLRATLLVLTDVHHEGTVPINTDKIVCDLSALRWIQATNLLLEGALPQSGWTVLRLQNPYDADFTRVCYATFHSFWSEWGGPFSANDVWQTGGRVVWQGPNFNIDVNRQYKLDGQGAVEVRNASFSADATPVKDLFDVEDYLCQVIIHDSNGRNFTTAKTTPNFTLNNCSEARDGASDILLGTNFSNTRSETLWAFDGGYPDPGRVTFATTNGTTNFPSVDATFGRKLVIVPNGNVISVIAQGLVRTKTIAGQQVGIAYRMKMPVFTGGQLTVNFVRNGSVVGSAIGITSENSDTEIEGIFQFVDTIGGASTLGFAFDAASMTGVSGNLELYYAAISLGKDIPQTTIPSFPNNVVTFATTSPSVGEWKRGDIIYNSSPSAGGTSGFICVASGTPGTWKTFGAISA